MNYDPSLNIPSSIFLSNTTINKNIAVNGDLIIGDNVKIDQGNYLIQATGNIIFNVSPQYLTGTIPMNYTLYNLTYKAGKEIIINPEVIINPTSIMIIDPSIIPLCMQINPTTTSNSDIATFCNNSVYNTLSRQKNSSNNNLSSFIENYTNQNQDDFSWDFEMYPNPTNPTTNIQFKGNFDESLEIHLVDITGKEVYSTTIKNTEHFTIEVSQLNKGIYFLGVISNGVTKTKQLIIQ